jgi:hypothetical protein
VWCTRADRRSHNFLGVSGDRRKRYVALRHRDSFGRALGELVMGG